MYRPEDCYWTVGDNAAQVFSSARRALVAVGDQTYTAWLADGNAPSRIASWAELHDVIMSAGLAAAAHAIVALKPDDVTPQQALDAAFAAGLAAAFAGAPELDGVYPIDAENRSRIAAIAASLRAAKGKRDGAVGFRDVAGEIHAFSGRQFLDFAAAVESYVFALYTAEATRLAGHGADMPNPAVTIL